MNTRDLLPLANHLWQSSIFATAVWLVTLALKNNRAALRYWLWLAASVKFIVPFSLLVGVGSLVRWRTAPIPPQIQSLSVIETVSQPFLRAGQFTNQMNTATADSVGLVLLGIWACGFVATLIFWVSCWYRLGVARRNSKPLSLGIPIPVFSTASRMEPGVFGFRKPVVLLPVGITDHLSPAQVDLVLAHEMCHISRRDNLTAAIQMVVETVFWFYPVVWWIRAQLVTERELACDEEICEQGHTPEEYAECILKVCRFYITSTPICRPGVTGASLKRRIGAMLTNSKPERLGIRKKIIVALLASSAVIAPVVVGVINAPPIEAESSTGRLQFDSASIKLSNNDSDTGIILHGRHSVSVNGTVIDLIESAYDVKRKQIIGGPAWLSSERYQIEGLSKRTITDARARGAVQELLADKFNLKVRREPTEVKAYALAGRPLSEITGAEAPDGLLRVALYQGFVWLQGTAVTTEQLVKRLSMFSDRPIHDRAGYEGRLDVDLQFATAAPKSDNALIRPMVSSPDKRRPPIADAVRDQLGLELTPVTDSVSCLVIEQVSRPRSK
jgi:uncharacterized protein (TIGR03435 family)